jgi:CheY-like chemotaxis protein
MAGDVAIESRPGKGTTVQLTLPAAVLPPSEKRIDARRAPAARRPHAEPIRILYVEDDPLVSLATVDLLKGAGYTVHAAPEAVRALDLLDEHPEIDLLVTDIGLPGMDGRALAAEARRRRPDLKLVFLTGYDRDGTSGERADGETEYLGKPYRDVELFDALRRLAGRETSQA